MTPRVAAQVAGRRVVAADGGMAHAAALAVTPELWVGDFDSAPDALQAKYADVPQLRFPADKDSTDGELAVDVALARGARHIMLLGALGGSTDHALGNLSLLLALRRRGIDAMATGGREEAYPLGPGSLRLTLPLGSRLSIIAFADLTGLSLSGVRWPLQRRDMLAGSSLTLSNEVTGPVVVDLEAGTALVLVDLLPAG